MAEETEAVARLKHTNAKLSEIIIKMKTDHRTITDNLSGKLQAATEQNHLLSTELSALKERYARLERKLQKALDDHNDFKRDQHRLRSSLDDVIRTAERERNYYDSNNQPPVQTFVFHFHGSPPRDSPPRGSPSKRGRSKDVRNDILNDYVVDEEEGVEEGAGAEEGVSANTAANAAANNARDSPRTPGNPAAKKRLHFG